MSAVLNIQAGSKPVSRTPAVLMLLDVAASRIKAPECDQLALVKARYPHAWWISRDPYEIAYWQLRQPVLLMTFDRLQEAVELCLGGPVDVDRFLDPQQLFNQIFNSNGSART